jgi:hypothetical protein
MAWERLLPVMVASTAGCSLVLDFSETAIPKDAEIDGAASQAECEFGEPNDTAAAATVFAAGDVGPAGICGDGFDDHDFYRLTVPANTSVSVQINFISSASGDLDLKLYDKTGTTVLASSIGFANVEQITCPGASPMCLALAPDDYLFEVLPAIIGAKNRYDIAVTITP